MYSTYESVNATSECESQPTQREKVIILGGGPNRIGQGIEFDYCCVHAVMALREVGLEAIMVNCNPETVSTDYDISDRLYFEPLTTEDILEIIIVEKSKGHLKGVIVQFGGQTPLKLASELETAGVPILGTTPDAIDLAEDRHRFQQLLRRLNLKQPPNGIANSPEEALAVAQRINFPVVVRPSYVLGGRAMEIVRDQEQLHSYMQEAVHVSGESPVLVDGYLQDAIEVDLDAISDGDNVYVAGIMEHIEEAGIHSGDSACSLPPHSLNKEVVSTISQQAEAMALGLSVVGLMNMQFAIQGNDIFILEVNPRASRTIPFVAKAVGQPIAKIAARIMAGEKLAKFRLESHSPNHVAVKESVFPFSRFPGVDVLLGPEMKSTGEVMGLDVSFAAAFAKSQIAAGIILPNSGNVFISVKDGDKAEATELAEKLVDLGFHIMATAGTAKYFSTKNIAVSPVKKVLEGRPHIVDAIANGEVSLIFNTTEGSQAIADSFTLRRSALTHRVPYYTTIAGAKSAMQAINHLRQNGLDVAPLQSYF